MRCNPLHPTPRKPYTRTGPPRPQAKETPCPAPLPPSPPPGAPPVLQRSPGCARWPRVLPLPPPTPAPPAAPCCESSTTSRRSRGTLARTPFPAAGAPANLSRCHPPSPIAPNSKPHCGCWRGSVRKVLGQARALFALCEGLDFDYMERRIAEETGGDYAVQDLQDQA